MPRVCTVCVHPDREAIDRALLAGEALRNIVERCSISLGALHRHKEHLPADLVRSKKAAEVAHADSLIGKVQALEADAKRIAKAAEAANDLRTALIGVRELTRIVELLAKLRGELDERAQINVLQLDPLTAAQMREDLAARLARTIPADPASLQPRPTQKGE